MDPVVGGRGVPPQSHGAGSAETHRPQPQEILHHPLHQRLGGRHGDGGHVVAHHPQVSLQDVGDAVHGVDIDGPVQRRGDDVSSPAQDDGVGAGGPLPHARRPLKGMPLLQLPLLPDLHRLVDGDAAGRVAAGPVLEGLEEELCEVPAVPLDEDVLTGGAGPLFPQDDVQGEPAGRLPPLVLRQAVEDHPEGDLGAEVDQLGVGGEVLLVLRHRLLAAEKEEAVEGRLGQPLHPGVGAAPVGERLIGGDGPVGVGLLQGLEEQRRELQVLARALEDVDVLRGEAVEERVHRSQEDVARRDVAHHPHGDGPLERPVTRVDEVVQGAGVAQAPEPLEEEVGPRHDPK